MQRKNPDRSDDSQFRPTLYDAIHPELARQLALPLAKLDREQRMAAGTPSVPFLGLEGSNG